MKQLKYISAFSISALLLFPQTALPDVFDLGAIEAANLILSELNQPQEIKGGCEIMRTGPDPVSPQGDLSVSDLSQWKCENIRSSVLSGNRKQRKWFASKVQPPRAIALVVHGLNNKPEVMDQIVENLQYQGIEVLRVGLTGHLGDVNAMKRITKDQWFLDIFYAYCGARLHSAETALPLYFVGYSLGGLLGEVLLKSDLPEKPQFDRAILFAPALSLHNSAKNIKNLYFAGDGFIVPGLSPKEYSAHRGCSIGGYKALFSLVDDVNSKGKSEAQNIPTLVFIDPKDELVSPKKLNAYIKDQKLDQWTIKYLDTNKAERNKDNLLLKYHHLIIDQESLGEEQWDSTVKSMNEWFSK